jgi:tetratricopeptide (TPR) repeat protein
MRLFFTSLLITLILKSAFSQSYDIHEGLALEAVDNRDAQTAIKELTKAVKYKKDPFAYQLRSLCYAMIGQLNSAYVDIDTALQIRPDYPPYLEYHAHFRYELGEKDEALKEINRCISLDSTRHFAYSVRSKIYSDAEIYNKAMEDIESAVKLQPSSAEYNLKRAQLLEKVGDYSTIQQAYLKAFYYSAPDDYIKSLACTYKLRALGYYDSALACLNYLIDIKGRYLGILKERGETFLGLKRYQEAIADFTEAIGNGKDSRSSSLYSSRGICYDSIGNSTQAFLDYTEAVSWDSTNAVAHLGMGSIYFRNGNTDQALNEFNKAIELNRKLGAGYYFRGLIYLNSYKDNEAACEDFTAARQCGYKPSVMMIRKYCNIN